MTGAETGYLRTGLSNDNGDGKGLLTPIRCHGGGEEKSHDVRDFTFVEDRSKVGTQSGTRVRATRRQGAISIGRRID